MSNDELYQYPLDTTGRAATNKVEGERQTINPSGMMDYYVLIPKAGPYFRDSLKLTLYPGGIELQPGIHYGYSHQFSSAIESIGVGVYGSITFYDHTLRGTVELEYQTLGGSWTLDEQEIAELLANILTDPRITTWEQITEMPTLFPPIAHEFNIDDFYGADDIVKVLERISEILADNSGAALQQHIADKNNPHQVTKAQVGLNLVENFAIAASGEANSNRNDRYMTPATTRAAMQGYMQPLLDEHKNDKNNPHAVTKTQVGLGNVENFALANEDEAGRGSSNARYMTPFLSAVAIKALVGDKLDQFIARRDNPHAVTKTQVGLGNLQNYPLATNQEIDAGTPADRYLNLAGVIYAIKVRVGDFLDRHTNDTDNPHQVNKQQVGLGNVSNFGTANRTQAEEAISDTLFMTPLGVRYAVAALVGGDGSGIGGHIADKNNPHEVTKTQVGLGNVQNFGKATVEQAATGDRDDLYVTPLGVQAAVGAMTAGDASKVFGMTQAQLADWVYNTNVANAERIANLDLDQLTAYIRNGKAADAAKFDGKTYAQLLDEIRQSGNSAFTSKVPGVYAVDDNGTEVELQESWTKVARINRQMQIDFMPALALALYGGQFEPQDEIPYQLMTASFYKSPEGLLTIDLGTIMSLNGITGGPGVGWTETVDNGVSYYDVWLKDGYLRAPLSLGVVSAVAIELLTVPEVFELDGMVTEEPGGIVYADYVGESATLEEVNLIKQGLEQQIGDLSTQLDNQVQSLNQSISQLGQSVSNAQQTADQASQAAVGAGQAAQTANQKATDLETQVSDLVSGMVQHFTALNQALDAL